MKVIRIIGRSITNACKSIARNFSLSMASITCTIITLILVSLGVLVSYFVRWLNLKSKELIAKQKNELGKKYLKMLNDTIIDCVMATT